jgi:amino acid efflux transporter
VSLCAGSQVPVYILGLAAGVKIVPTFSRLWWLSASSTAAVAVLLVAAGLYPIVPVVIAVAVIGRHWLTLRAGTADL